MTLPIVPTIAGANFPVNPAAFVAIAVGPMLAAWNMSRRRSSFRVHSSKGISPSEVATKSRSKFSWNHILSFRVAKTRTMAKGLTKVKKGEEMQKKFNRRDGSYSARESGWCKWHFLSLRTHQTSETSNRARVDRRLSRGYPFLLPLS